MRIFSVFAAVFMALCLVFVPVMSLALEVPAVPQTGMAYVIMDAESGYVIAASGNCNDRFYPASLTKVVTAMVALDHSTDLDRSMTVTQTAINGIGADGQNTGLLKAGSVMDYGSLMKIMMVWSANETAYAIAENISGTVEAFVEEMNNKAADLGLTGTHFVNPCGMHSDEHYTTPMDMARIARAALRYQQIMEISSMPSVDIHFNDQRYTYYSTSRLINPAHYGLTYNMSYTNNGESHSFKVTGLKTGYTDPAGCCLVTTSDGTDGRSIITVVMKASTSAIAADYSYKLLQFAYSNASFYDICTEGQPCCTVGVTGSPLTQTELVYGSSLRISALPDRFDPAQVTSKALIPDTLSAPIDQGYTVGSAGFIYGSGLTPFASVPVVTSVELPTTTPVPTAAPTPTPEPPDTSEAGNNVFDIIIISVVGFALFVAGAVLISRINRK